MTAATFASEKMDCQVPQSLAEQLAWREGSKWLANAEEGMQVEAEAAKPEPTVWWKCERRKR